MNASLEEISHTRDEAAPGVNRPTILLLDDDSITLLVLRAILERTTANILECEHERCAVETCGQTSGIDLFVADVVLPASNGPAVVRKVKPLQPQMRLLFISGFSLAELGKRGLLSKDEIFPGRVEFLQKPFSPDTFLATVEKLLNQNN